MEGIGARGKKGGMEVRVQTCQKPLDKKKQASKKVGTASNTRFSVCVLRYSVVKSNRLTAPLNIMHPAFVCSRTPMSNNSHMVQQNHRLLLLRMLSQLQYLFGETGARCLKVVATHTYPFRRSRPEKHDCGSHADDCTGRNVLEKAETWPM